LQQFHHFYLYILLHKNESQAALEEALVVRVVEQEVPLELGGLVVRALLGLGLERLVEALPALGSLLLDLCFARVLLALSLQHLLKLALRVEQPLDSLLLVLLSYLLFLPLVLLEFSPLAYFQTSSFLILKLWFVQMILNLTSLFSHLKRDE
jgi:hypothetical protein